MLLLRDLTYTHRIRRTVSADVKTTCGRLGLRLVTGEVVQVQVMRFNSEKRHDDSVGDADPDWIVGETRNEVHFRWHSAVEPSVLTS